MHRPTAATAATSPLQSLPVPLDQPDSWPQDATDDALTLGMPLGDHIDELRRRLILALIGLGVALIFTFWKGEWIMLWIAQPLFDAQSALGYPPQTITTEPTAGFMSVYMKVALISAVILASPWILFQIWQFIVSGLYPSERRTIYILAPFSTLMTALGVLFTYYILLPICLVFFLNFARYYPEVPVQEPSWLIRQLTSGIQTAPDRAEPTPGSLPLTLPLLDHDPPVESLDEGQLWIDLRLSQIKVVIGGQIRAINLTPNRMLTPMPEVGAYIRFASMMGLGIALAFQTPVLMLVLGWTRLVDPKWLGASRKYAIFGCFVAGAILTPTDLLSMFVVALPLWGLYEFGLLLMRRVYQQREEAAPPDEL